MSDFSFKKRGLVADNYRSRLTAMITSTVSDTRQANALIETILDLNQAEIETHRLKLKESELTYTNNAVALQIAKLLGTEE